MKPSSLANKLICPVDNHELELRMYSRGSSYHAAEGIYSCTCCKRYYPVVNGVPAFAPALNETPVIAERRILNVERQFAEYA